MAYIIQSLLDADFYKFTMGQLVFHRYPDVPVKYAFKNRTIKVPLARFIKERDLRRELDHVRELRFSDSELHYLRGTNEYSERMFKEDYLDFLRQLKLPPYDLRQVDGQYELEFSGRWSEAIYWETLALAIINELYYRSQMKKLSCFQQDVAYAIGRLRLAKKIISLKENPAITFTDFGTRRRFSREWQDYVVKSLIEEIRPGQFLGTSNVYLAMKHGVVPMGTSAHEMYMVMAGRMFDSDERLYASHNQVLQDWWAEYGYGLSIALTDTYGSDFFFRDMTKEQAENWKGLRQDSGDPINFGLQAIKFYKKYGLDPMSKLLVFSDGLDIDSIIGIADIFKDRIKVTFGWGTNLTNDLGFKPLSLVVKIKEANGHGVVKLSDNLAKAMGESADIERFKRVFGHQLANCQECVY